MNNNIPGYLYTYTLYIKGRENFQLLMDTVGDLGRGLRRVGGLSKCYFIRISRKSKVAGEKEKNFH